LTSLWLRSPLLAMARKLRAEYPGAIYHVMNRGGRREAIVKDAADRLQFLETLGEACVRTKALCNIFLAPNTGKPRMYLKVIHTQTAIVPGSAPAPLPHPAAVPADLSSAPPGMPSTRSSGALSSQLSTPSRTTSAKVGHHQNLKSGSFK
jgi:hypothetical protein